MPIKDNIFRSYDIRGIYPEELDENAVYYTTKAFCDLYPHLKIVVLAYDPRPSSRPLADAATKAFLEAGKEVIDLGIAPDPLWYFSIFHYNYDGGLMISGSHNPSHHNGLTYHARKTAGVPSEELMGSALQDLKKLAQKLEVVKAPRELSGKVTKRDPSEEYIDYIVSRVKISRPLKIALDTGNGACGYLPERLFKRLGCEVLTIYAEFDGTFPNHLPDPYVEANRLDLEKKVLEIGADMGFVYDTDGDRVAIIDNRGRSVNGDDSLLILARQAVAKKVGSVVHCMRTSKAFIDDMAKRGATTHFSVSHHNAVRDKVKKLGAVFGGEITFHYAFPLDYYLVDDAVFASVELAIVAAEQPDFAAYVDTLPHYFASPELFINAGDDVKFGIIETLQKYLRENNYNFIDVDGARINFEHGWALARVSNTTPIIKCRFEGNTPEALREIELKALDIFKTAGIPITDNDLEKLGLK
ncbi:MAG: phosphomannomutase/phosphoglucomutase [Candidatus Nealsonbacteria bacterium]|nr:phosphomannomutase/phosphoglucomutase [Candidatus Nealsonbacteria bacterium]